MPLSSHTPDVVMFMSADVVGSTAFKATSRVESGHAAWLEAFETLFRELPLIFIGQMAGAFFDQDDLPESGVWKVMGDEVVFIALPRSLADAQRIAAAFYGTVVSYDRRLAERWPLRIRGCCWAADLVERNRMIEIPEMFGGTDGRYRDFLGPDIDAGFRLSAHSGSGELIVSPNLAEAFAQDPQAGLRFHWLGRKPMKGVCGGEPFPLVMVSVAPDPAAPPLAAGREIIDAGALRRELSGIRAAMLQHGIEMAAPVFAAGGPSVSK